MSGFGTQQWGVDGFGGLGANLTVSHAYAISTHEVVVVLSKPLQDVSGFLPGDVSNPGSWEVSVPSTLEVLDVAGVASFAHPLEWVVRTLQRLPDSLTTARVKATALKDAAGGVVSTPDYADFAGVTEQALSTPQQVADTRTRGGRDLRNLSQPSISETSVSGTLVVVGGDYALDDGADLVRKLITRRLMTAPGEFFHLPTYGCGFKVKQPLPGGGLIRLKTEIERQLRLEPDVATVVVQLSQRANILTCVVNATLARSGRRVTVSASTQGVG